jgi:hypothetical protein
MRKKDQIAELVKKYFSPGIASNIIDKVNSHVEDDNKVIFFQIVEEGNDLRLEMAVNEDTTIRDLVFRSASCQFCALRYDAITSIRFDEDEKRAYLKLVTNGPAYLHYTSIAPPSREMLKGFYKHVLYVYEQRRGL